MKESRSPAQLRKNESIYSVGGKLCGVFCLCHLPDQKLKALLYAPPNNQNNQHLFPKISNSRGSKPDTY
jgi:hypothetical protein